MNDTHPAMVSVARFSQLLRAGVIGVAEVTRHCLERIAVLDGGVPVNAITLINPAALDDASALDREYATSGARSPMHGVPIVIKDNIDVAGLPTTAGCAALKDTRPLHDAPVVAALRAAGAVILGKTNMSEFAASNGRPGYSSAGGLTRNPLNPALHASGSSSGSAAAVAAGFAPAALGTDTFGSVRGPASVTGCVSLRPTRGLLSLKGIFPLTPSFDVAGPIVRDAADLPILMHVLAQGKRAYRHALREDALRTARLLVAEPWPSMHEDVGVAFGDMLGDLQKLGACVTALAGVPDGNTIARALMTPLAEAEFARAAQRWLACTPGAPVSLPALIADMEMHGARYPDRATSAETLAMVRRLADLDQAARTDPGKEQARSLQRRLRLERFREDAFAWFRRGVDALVFPTHLGLPGEAIDAAAPLPPQLPYAPMAASYLASALGFPEVTVPAMRSRNGLPIGLSFMGPPASEQRLMDLAFAVQVAIRNP